MLETDRSQDGRDTAVDTPSPPSTPVGRDRGAALADAGVRREYALAYRATVDAAYAEHAGRRPDADARRGAGSQAADTAGTQRPDMAERYPGRYARPADPPPRVDGPGEHPGRWVDGIYPGRDRHERPDNCGECARAVDTTWHGTPAAAAELAGRRVGGERPAVMSEWAGHSPEPASMADIGRRLRELGHGSSAVVGFDRADAPGHWFNAVNHEGAILAVDG
jgi:Papain fold toxin 1, glutamine deamidase